MRKYADTQIEPHRVTEITERENTISAMEPETVPDTQDIYVYVVK